MLLQSSHMSCTINGGKSLRLVFYSRMWRLLKVVIVVVAIVGHIHGLTLLHCSTHNRVEHIIIVLKYSAIAQSSLNRNWKKYIRHVP